MRTQLRVMFCLIAGPIGVAFSDPKQKTGIYIENGRTRDQLLLNGTLYIVRENFDDKCKYITVLFLEEPVFMFLIF